MKHCSLSLLLVVVALCTGRAAAVFTAAADTVADLLPFAGRTLLQDVASPLDRDAPFDAASAPEDPATGLRSGGLSASAPRPFCRALDVYAPVDNYDPANPAGYFRGFGTLTFSYQARDVASGAFVTVSPRFALTLDPLGLGVPDCVFIQSDGSESKTTLDGLGLEVRPVGWRCTYLLDPASIPTGGPVTTTADPQTFKAGSTCTMLRRLGYRSVVRYQGRTSADFTYTPGVTTSLTVECRELPTQVCGDVISGPSGKEVVPCATAGILLGRTPAAASTVLSAYGGYALSPMAAAAAPYRADVIDFSEPGVQYSPISGELLRYGLNLRTMPQDRLARIVGSVDSVIENAVCIFGVTRSGTTTRVNARIIANPRRNSVRAECRFEVATC